MNPEPAETSAQTARRGMTLVEIMVALLILTVLVIGGSSVIYRGRADIVVQKYKRAAVEAANARLEQLTHQWDYTNVVNLIGAPAVETVSLNGISGFSRTTTVTDGGPGADNCLRVSVSVQYRKGGGDVVTLETLRAP